MINILYVFRRKRTERLDLYRQGFGPDEMLYGMNHFDDQRFVVDYVEGEADRPAWWKNLVRPLQRSIARPIRMGFALDMILENLSRFKKADVIISTVDACGLPITLLKRLGIIRAPIIYFSQGLSDRVEALSRRLWLQHFYKTFYSWLLRACESLFTLGEGAAQHLVRIMDLRGKEVKVIPFGVDIEFWHPADPGAPVGDYILSVGSDPARDYDRLLQAIGDRKLKIVTRLPLEIADPFKQVEIQSNISDIELRALYQGAQFVVIPLKDVAQPSGQSVALQSMACGKAVILTSTHGLWEPEIIKHLDVVYLVRPNDAQSLAQAIEDLATNSTLVEKLACNSLALVRQRYNSTEFGKYIQANLPSYDRH
ncbi:MAG TPA: glycosyltransferase family 4 protein [Anaerolineales bacterium]|nr:glycosyltransferase family 4 protein [Anaerolineales bacterium]